MIRGFFKKINPLWVVCILLVINIYITLVTSNKLTVLEENTTYISSVCGQVSDDVNYAAREIKGEIKEAIRSAKAKIMCAVEGGMFCSLQR